MADKKISQLPAATIPLAGTEVLPIVQSSTTDQVSVANLTAGRAVSAASLTLTSSPLPIASGGTNQTAFTGPSGNVKGLVYFDGTSFANDATVTDVGYDTSTNTVQARNFSASGTASITGNLTVDTTTLKVDATNNYVGIGLASPAYQADILSPLTGTTAGSNAILNVSSNASGRDSHIRLADNVNASGRVGYLSGALYMWTNAAQRFTVQLTGDCTVNTGNLVIGTSGKGIDFSATDSGSGTMTSELLSDYEEGTWTPTASGLTTVGSPTYTATYTKIGRMVTLSLIISPGTSTASSGGTTYFSGLPYVPASNTTCAAGAVGDAGTINLGNCIIYGSTPPRIYTPTWSVNTNAIALTIQYQV